MSERPALHHMLILQGSDFEREFELRAGVAVRLPVALFAGEGTVYIWDSPIAAAAGTVLQFGKQNFTLSFALAVGQRSIQVTSGGLWSGPSEKLEEGAEIAVKPIDVTGWTFQSQIWVSQEAKLALLAPLASFTYAVSNGAGGKFKLSLPKAISMTLKPTCSWEDTINVRLEDIGKTEFDLKKIYGNQYWRPLSLAGSAYYYDIESTDLNAKTQRRVEGYVVVSKERTR